MPYGARLDTLPIQQPRRSRLAIRLIARDGRATVVRRTLLPVIGADDVILPAFDHTLGNIAIRAQQGDTDARDALFFAFLPKLDKLVTAIRVPSAPIGTTGTWDRDDVEQEAYLVFVELLHGWSGDVSFTAWLLARFSWRLRDALRDGVGKPLLPPRVQWMSLDDAELREERALLVDDFDPEDHKLVEILVDSLPPELSQVLVLRALRGKPLAEIAREMQLSRRTLVRRWHEIRRHAIEVIDGLTAEYPG